MKHTKQVKIFGRGKIARISVVNAEGSILNGRKIPGFPALNWVIVKMDKINITF